MKVLKYGNRKCNDVLWDASTPEKEKAALRCLFKLLDDQSMYCDLDLEEIAATRKKIDELEKLETDSKEGRIPASLKEYVAMKVEEIRSKREMFAHIQRQRNWYLDALTGSDAAIKLLLIDRKGFEYEEWEFIEVRDPLG